MPFGFGLIDIGRSALRSRKKDKHPKYDIPPDTTTTVSSAPWEAQKPFLETGFKSSLDNVLNQPREVYPGTVVAPFAPETEEGLDLTAARARAGSPLTRSAQNQLQDTLNGQYLYGGDAYNAAFDAAANRIIPKVNSQFALAGRSNSGLARESMTRALADANASLYSNERQNQIRSMLFAPQLAEADYTDLGRLLNVGSAREALLGEQLEEEAKKYHFQEMEPTQRTQDYMNLIQGNYGGTTSTTGPNPYLQPRFRNTGSNVVGGALSGAQLGSAFGPPGMAIGGVLGGLAGGFL